jgi:FkbM family methyltransferase
VAGLDYEPELRWLMDQLSPGDVFVDVGANIGIYSLHCGRKVGPRGHVFAVEPCTPAVALLENNVRSNKLSETVTVVHAAAADKAGSLYLSGDPTKWNSLQLSPEPPGSEIRVTTIDEILAPHRQADQIVKCIKIDAEGAETEVLCGASNTISQHRPIVIFENIFASTHNQAAAWLEQHGYAIHSLDRKSVIGQTAVHCRHHALNLIALHKKHLPSWTTGK